MNWPVIKESDNTVVTINNKQLVNYTSNDYLGLSQNNELKDTVSEAIKAYGLGSTGSRRLSGNHQVFLDTEKLIAHWIGKEAGVMFNSGYQMNCSLFSVLASKSTLILADKLSHASLIDGIQSSPAQLMRFRHNDIQHLSQLLKKYAHQYESILIVCESIYSMDGDEAPIHDIIELKTKYNATLLVDEAHSIGLYGDGGNGWLNQHQVMPQIDIILIPFGKAFGLSGAMFVSNKHFTSLIKAKCRGYIYSTALPIAIGIGIKKACQLIQASDNLRQSLTNHIQTFKSIIKTDSNSQIQPIIIGANHHAAECEKALMDLGFFVRAVHHPTVPKGQSRLRITLSAHLKSDQIIELGNQVNTVLDTIKQAV